MNKRMIDAVEGRLPMEQLTDKELMKLQKRVMKAVAEKVAASESKMLFKPHRTLQ